MSHKLWFLFFLYFLFLFWCRIVARLSPDCMDCKCTGEVPELPKSLPPPVSVHLCTWLEQDWSRIVNRNDSNELQSTWIGLGLESGLKDCRNYQQSASIEAVLDPLCTLCPHVHLMHLDWIGAGLSLDCKSDRIQPDCFFVPPILQDCLLIVWIGIWLLILDWKRIEWGLSHDSIRIGVGLKRDWRIVSAQGKCPNFQNPYPHLCLCTCALDWSRIGAGLSSGMIQSNYNRLGLA